MKQPEKKYRKGHFLNFYMAVGIAVGSGIIIPLSILTNNLAFIGLGPGLGLVIGMSIGQAMEEKYSRQGKVRPLTAEEENEKKISRKYLFSLLLVGVLLFLFLVIYLNL